MAPFDRPYTTFYWPACTNIALTCTLFELFDAESYRDLQIWLEVTQGHSNWYRSKVGCGFAFCSNYGPILHHFGDKATYWSKIVIFSYPLAFGAPIRGSPSDYCHPVWCWKTSIGETRWWKKIGRYWEPFRQNTGVWRTDGQTDRQTDR